MRQIKTSIKRGREKGKLILYKPDELVHSAVVLAMKAKNDKETIWWALKKSVLTTTFTFHETVDVKKNPKKPQKGWHAFAKGTVMLGKTDVKTDKFFDAKKYAFDLEYRTGRDELGLPDIEVLKAEFTLIDPSGKAAFANISLKNIPPASAKAMTAEKYLGLVKEGKMVPPEPVRSAPAKPVPFETKAPAPKAPEPEKKA